jgi:predicted TIM-barrel fold metal-dependent hydrolase
LTGGDRCDRPFPHWEETPMTALTERPDLEPLVARIPPIVDVDAHLVEPPNIWVDRLPARYRDVGPRVEYLPPGTPILDGGGYIEAPGTEGDPVAWWHYEDQLYSVKRLIAAAGYAPEEITLEGVTFEQMRKGCWDPKARLEDMTLNGVEAQLCFPNYPRFCGQIFLKAKDKELARLCVEAYNDWMVEEWCGHSGGRLVPLCLVPLWDAQLAAAEVRRNAARGVRAVAFSEIPAYLGLPSLHSGHWDPFFEACDETGTVVCMHIGSGTKTPNSSPDAPELVNAVAIFGNSAVSLIDFLFSGRLAKFPNLKLMYAEAQIGWIPYVVQRCDDTWETHLWAHKDAVLDEMPSYYYRRQVHSCFFKDPVGVRMIDEVGADNILFETDYPHQDSTWPHSREAAAVQFGHLDEHLVRKIARGNAIRLLDLDLEP